MTEIEKLAEIDFILMQLEDYAHGEEGKQITKARKILQELSKASNTAAPDIVESEAIPENTSLWNVLVGVRDFKYFIQDAVNYININRQSILAEDFIEYCYDFAWQYGRLFHVGDAEKIKVAISEKFQLPEEFLQNKKIQLNEQTKEVSTNQK